MSEKKFRCQYGRHVGDLMLCSLPCEKTGAKEAWRAKDPGPDGNPEYIHEPWWCTHKCRWWTEHGHEEDQ